MMSLYRVSAEKWRSARAGREARVNLRLNVTIRAAVFCFEESTQSGIQIQLDWSLLMICREN